MMPLQNDADFYHESIYRKVEITRYAEWLSGKVWNIISETNTEIGRYLLRKQIIETRGQYADAKAFIQEKLTEVRKSVFNYVTKELEDFAGEQYTWIYDFAIEPEGEPLEKVNKDRVISDVFFEAYSDTDTVKSYIENIFNQIFQIWNARLTIAQRTNLPMAELVYEVIGRRL